jgi:CBS domain-containing protein
VHHDDDDRREVRGHAQTGHAGGGAGDGDPGERLTELPGAAAEVVEFLRAHPPFDALELEVVRRVAASAEVEFFRTGDTVFSQGAEPVAYLRVVRSGAVEIIHDERVLDLLGVGELFGQASMLSGLPPGFAARAAENTLCYRIPEAEARSLLAREENIRFVARSLLDHPTVGAKAEPAPPRDPAHQPVATLLRDPPVVCAPEASIREAAQLMTAAGATSVVVDLGAGSLGILTDHDLRTRVVAGGISTDAPVSAAMTAPAYTCQPDRLGGEVLLDMLDRGFRHFPVVAATGEILGVVSDMDLVATEARSSFYLRQAIARAKTVSELVKAARELRPTVLALHDARAAATNICAVYTVVVDALTRRLLELAVHEAGEPAAPFAWLALGSGARREATPASDVDSAIVWFGEVGDGEIRPYLHEIAKQVATGLEACGLRIDDHGATASDLRFVRSLESWQRAARSWLADPNQEQALILVSVLVDSRPVWGVHTGTPVADTFKLAPKHPGLLRLLARFALSYRPPTGFFRGLVVEHSGEHRGRLDLKHGGMIPIVDLARWAGMAAGVTSASTIERLHAARQTGTLSAADAHTLEDAFELITELRVEHHVEQLRAGVELDDYLNPSALSALTRRHLKEAFRAVASIQRRVSNELSLGIR